MISRKNTQVRFNLLMNIYFSQKQLQINTKSIYCNNQCVKTDIANRKILIFVDVLLHFYKLLPFKSVISDFVRG